MSKAQMPDHINIILIVVSMASKVETILIPDLVAANQSAVMSRAASWALNRASDPTSVNAWWASDSLICLQFHSMTETLITAFASVFCATLN